VGESGNNVLYIVWRRKTQLWGGVKRSSDRIGSRSNRSVKPKCHDRMKERICAVANLHGDSCLPSRYGNNQGAPSVWCTGNTPHDGVMTDGNAQLHFDF